MVTLVAKPAQKGKVFVGWQNEKGEMVIGTAEPTYTYYASESLALAAVYANAPYEGLSGGAIAGIVAGDVAFVSLGCFALRWFVIKKKSLPDLCAVFKKK